MINSGSSLHLHESRIHKVDTSKSMDQSIRFFGDSNRSQAPPLDFNRLSPEQQQVYLNWSQQQNDIPTHNFLFQSINHNQTQTTFLLQQQQLVEQYNQQFMTIQAPLPQENQQQVEQLQPEPQPQIYQQEYLPTQYDQLGLERKWQVEREELIKNMRPHISLDEPNLPSFYKYFDASKEKIGNQYYGDYFELTHKMNPQFKLCLKLDSYDNYKQFEYDEKQLQITKQYFTHPNLINLHLIHTKKFVCLCFSTNRVCQLYDNIETNMQNQIKLQYFDELEVLQILESMVEALYSLHLKGIIHGHVSLDYIIQTTQIDGIKVYKLYYPKIIHFNKDIKINSLIQDKNLRPTDPIYLSPDQLQCLHRENLYVPSWKCDIFCLGICILALCLGPDRHSEIDLIYTEYGINEAELQNMIKRLSGDFSQKLISILLQMTNITQPRPDLITLNHLISNLNLEHINYANMIYDLEVQTRFENKLKVRSKIQRSQYQTDRTNLSDLNKKESKKDFKQSQIEKTTVRNNLVENRNKRRIQYKDGSYYDGDVFNGLRDGIGQYCHDNKVWDGCWKYDQQNGHSNYYENGYLIYEGNFINGLYDGFGKLRNPNPKYFNTPIDYKDLTSDCWLSYQGDFHQGKFHGFGTLEYANQERLTCIFRDGIPDGVGVFETLDKRRINAQWDTGILVRRI
ncbi:hypothetical protein pb186bvf_019114 [Paramecium bursaria]